MTATATQRLIDSLTTDVQPVRRLRPPLLRLSLWLGFALMIVAMLGVSHGVRTDLVQRFQDPVFALRVGGALLTGVLAAMSAFLISLPDRLRTWGLLPAPAAVVWLSTIGYGCLTNWMRLPSDGIPVDEVMSCLATLVLTGAPLSLALFIMVRRAHPLHPAPVTICGALAVAAITATALSLFHSIDATALILIWNLGTAATFLGLGAVLGLGARSA